MVNILKGEEFYRADFHISCSLALYCSPLYRSVSISVLEKWNPPTVDLPSSD